MHTGAVSQFPISSGRHRQWLRWLAGLLLLLTLTLTLALLLTQLPAREPTVLQTATLKVDDVERALQLARQHDPRHAIPGVVRTLRLTQREAELLINHAAARWRLSC